MQREPTIIHDLIIGEVHRDLTDREQVDPDFVIVRSDGGPMFHLVNVVDDLEMGITHVIRGEDHLSNTAKHIALFRAFGVEPPKYAHIPLILNADGTKMSKRDRGASLTTYLDEGFLPEAVDNYLCLLGWSPKDNTEKISLAEVIERFDLPQILRHNARFDFEKLLWLQGEYCRELPDDRFYELSVHALAKAGIDTNKFAVTTSRPRSTRARGRSRYSANCRAMADSISATKSSTTRKPRRKVSFLKTNRASKNSAMPSPNWKSSMPRSIEAALKATAAELGVKAGVLVHPVRLACTGNSSGPSLYHLLEVIGKEKTMARIEKRLSDARFGG